jgi:uncharacterized membrane protein
MQMLKDKWANFRANTMAFFKPEGVWNRQAVIAVLIGGFIGWLIITVTFGMRLKKLLKKVPGVKMLFGTTKRVVRRSASAARSTARRAASYRRRK